VPLDLTPLESLSPAVERAAGAKAPAPLRMMAARGLAPLGPQDLVTAIYQLAVSDDAALKSAALKTAVEVPEMILRGALAEPLDARVLDFFARRVSQKPKLLEVVLLNRHTDDETFRHLATVCPEAELEMIAKNEERLLRTPAIIAALYLNPKTRMSTAQRAIELAVRNGVRVDGIPSFDEAARAIEQSGARSPEEIAAEDAAFQRAAEVAVDLAAQLGLVALDEKEAAQQAEADAEAAEAIAEGKVAPEGAEEAEEKKKKLTDLSPAGKIRAATLGNAFARAVLIRDTNRQVSMACIRSPAVSDAEALRYASNRALDDDIIRYIANNRQWTRLYGVKVALVNNPKCPIPTSMRLLPHLSVRDLKNLARSKGIASAIATAAKNLLSARNA
jgi:hypothetical protein